MKSPKVIIAGPGTGKTTKIIELVRDFLTTNESNKGFVLCTFTRKAAEELQYRLFKTIDTSIISDTKYLIETIHSISLSLLKLHPSGKYADFEIIPEEQQASYINGILPKIGFDRDNFKGHELWTLCSNIAEIFGYITDRQIDYEKLNFGTNSDLQTIVDNYSLYRKLLIKDRKFDFATVQSTLKDEIQSDANFHKLMRDDFEIFFVDEYQDTNSIQHELLMNLARPEFNIVVVGDDDQSIYGFRGAKVENLLSLPEFYRRQVIDYEIEYLENNHRSIREIVEFSRSVILNSSLKGYSKKIVSNRGKGAISPILQEYSSILEEAEAIALNIQQLFQSQAIESFSEIAILLRTAKNHAEYFGNALESKSIPFQLVGVGNFFDLVCVKEFMSLLNFILDSDLNSVDNFHSKLDEIDAELTAFYFDDEIILKIIDIKDRWRNYKSNIAIVYDLLMASDFFDRYAEEGQNLGKITQIVMNHDENIKGLDLFGVFSYFAFLKREKMIDAETTGRTDAVQIMTIHKSKGLEFDAVYLPAQNQLTPQANLVDEFKTIAKISDSGIDEEIRLFYVGMTRARNFLWVSRCMASPTGKKIYKASNGYEAALKSPELFEKGDFFKKSDTIKATPKNRKIVPLISYNSIYTYSICPKQYMYRNVWKLETARNAGMTYGSNLHKAIQILNDEISKNTKKEMIDLNSIMDLAWSENWRINENENTRLKETALKQISIYLENFPANFGKYKIFGIEKQFDITIDETLITGRYDAIFKNDEDLLVIDFKTGDVRDYSLQMSFYEYCLAHEYPDLDISSMIYYLNTGILEKSKRISDNSITEKISLTKNGIQDEDFTPRPGNHCSDCSFNLLCKDALSIS